MHHIYLECRNKGSLPTNHKSHFQKKNTDSSNIFEFKKEYMFGKYDDYE